MKIEFTKAFAVYKKGDTVELEAPLCARLIRRKVAKAVQEKKK